MNLPRTPEPSDPPTSAPPSAGLDFITSRWTTRRNTTEPARAVGAEPLQQPPAAMPWPVGDPTDSTAALDIGAPADAGLFGDGRFGDGGEGDLLSAPIDDVDLAQTLARTRSGGRPPWSTTLLGAALITGLAFTGGVLAQKAATPAATAATAGRATTGSAAAAGTGRTFAGGSGSSAGAAAAGTIQLIDGTTIYVQTTGGGITKVLTGPGTTIRVTTTGTVKNLAPGTPVVVQGVRAADGTVQATGITQGAAAAAAGRSASTPATPGG